MNYNDLTVKFNKTRYSLYLKNSHSSKQNPISICYNILKMRRL